MAVCRAVAAVQAAPSLVQRCCTAAAGTPQSARVHTGSLGSLPPRTSTFMPSNGLSQSPGSMVGLSGRMMKECKFVLRVSSSAAELATDSKTTRKTEEQLIRQADGYFSTDMRPIVLFDGVCNFCNGGVNFVLDNDPAGRVRFAALQSEAGRALLLRSGRSPNDISSLVLVEKDRSYIKSEGVLRTAQYLGSLLPPIGSLGLLFPLFFRDFLYDNVANNRYSILGQRDVCRVSDSQFKDRFVE